MYFDKTKWNIPNDGTKNKKSQETEARIRRLLTHCEDCSELEKRTNEMRKSDFRGEDLG